MAEHLMRICAGPLSIQVDADLGGHILEFSLDGVNSLAVTGPEIGSTFWPSPQNDWGWPPPKALDKGAYRVIEQNRHLELISAVCEVTGLQVRKVFSFKVGALEAEYHLINHRKQACSFAPWEITRIQGGLTFYESAEPPLLVSTGVAVLEQGAVWHHYRPEMQEHNEKVFGNGSSGWIANAHKGLLLIKEFVPVSAMDLAPGEAEVEIYSHGDPQNPYIEMEQQGAYQMIPPDGELAWTVRWHLRKLSERTEVCVGSTQLLELAKSVLA